jgi:hypothetical protein
MKKMIALAFTLVLALAGGGAWIAAAPQALSLDDMRQAQSDAWVTLRGYCVDSIHQSSKDSAEACTDFADSVLTKSARAGTTIESYMVEHPDLYSISQIPSSFRVVVARNKQRKA